MKTKMSDRLLAAAALTVALGVAYPCAAQQQLVFSGFPGVTSHQRRSSLSFFIANKLTALCASCGGLNDPPNKPMR